VLGFKSQSFFSPEQSMNREPIVRLENVTVRYGTLTALDQLNLELRRGELFGLLGASGAGKSTALRLLIGQVRPVSGRVTVADQDLSRHWQGLKPFFGYMPDRDNHYEEFSIRRNLLLFAGLYRLPRSRVEECLKLADLTESADMPVQACSLGMRRKLLFARALLHRPALLFLDEPTANLDAAAADLVCRTLHGLTREGCTVLLTTHDRPMAERLCDRIGVLQRGRLMEPRGCRAALQLSEK
jgi:ABC-type multidrug transport system ATPase subunit